MIRIKNFHQGLIDKLEDGGEFYTVEEGLSMGIIDEREVKAYKENMPYDLGEVIIFRPLDTTIDSPIWLHEDGVMVWVWERKCGEIVVVPC